MTKNETKFPSLEKEAADALEVAAQTNEEREEKTAKKSISSHLQVFPMGFYWKEFDKDEFLDSIIHGSRVAVEYSTLFKKIAQEIGYVSRITSYDITLASRDPRRNMSFMELGDKCIGLNSILRYEVIKD